MIVVLLNKTSLETKEEWKFSFFIFSEKMDLKIKKEEVVVQDRLQRKMFTDDKRLEFLNLFSGLMDFIDIKVEKEHDTQQKEKSVKQENEPDPIQMLTFWAQTVFW